MAKANANTKKIVRVKYWEEYQYNLRILVPVATTPEDLEEVCTEWPDSMLRGCDPTFNYEFAVKGESRPSPCHHFEMIPQKRGWTLRFDDCRGKEVEVEI